MGDETSAGGPASDARLSGTTRAFPHYTPLFRRVVALNGVVLVVACTVTVAILSPRRLTSILSEEVVLLLAALALLALVNFALLRRAFSPLERLTRLTRTVDGSRPGQRVPSEKGQSSSEAAELAAAFNEMLDRLEAERRDSTRRVLGAQEGERLRVAQELHDEVGQTLTAVLLQLGHMTRGAPDEMRELIGEAQETVRASLEDVRRIAQELRPETLDDLGLPSALVALTERLEAHTGVRVGHRLDRALPALPAEVELVVYRVAQEALTNVVRHAESPRAELCLERHAQGVRLRVLDAGAGFDPVALRTGNGLQGMHERASLVGGTLAVDARPGGGTEVRLDVPLVVEAPA